MEEDGAHTHMEEDGSIHEDGDRLWAAVSADDEQDNVAVVAA